MIPKTQPTLFDDEAVDDLFSRPPRTTRIQMLDEIWITCRVCEMRSKVTVDNPALLCGPCRVDTAQTQAHVEEMLTTTEKRWRDAVMAFDTQAAGVPQWAAIEQARLSAPPALFAEAWRRRKTEGGALGKLLAAKEALDELSDEVQRRRAWAKSALQEIKAYERR